MLLPGFELGNLLLQRRKMLPRGKQLLLQSLALRLFLFDLRLETLILCVRRAETLNVFRNQASLLGKMPLGFDELVPQIAQFCLERCGAIDPL
jgi:hypothetical protein